ncbi:MAG: hypothetical protein OCD76_16940 [Reichenbachiella sp.]
MKLPENLLLRTGIIVLFNLVIFVGLVYASIFFEFLALGWGASAQAPDFNADLTSICLIAILSILAFKKKSLEYAVSTAAVIIAYLTLKLIIGLI